MESELVNLQQRVAELEEALAAVAAHQRPSRSRWRTALVSMFCAGIVAIGLAVALARPASATLTDQGPSKVVAPFQVVDSAGRVLFNVESQPAGGVIGIFNTKGDRVIELLAGPEGSSSIGLIDKGIRKVHLVLDGQAGGTVIVGGDETTTHIVEDGVKVMSPGKAGTNPVVGLGLSEDGQGTLQIFNSAGKLAVELGIAKTNNAGLAKLFSSTQAQMILNGEVGIRQTNAQGQPVFQAGVDDNGQGYAMAANKAGAYVSKISVAADGSSGRVEVSSGGEVKGLMGVLQNGKGDVCASGDPGKQVCLSGLAAKSFIPY